MATEEINVGVGIRQQLVGSDGFQCFLLLECCELCEMLKLSAQNNEPDFWL